MLTTLKNAFKMKELRKKILYTLAMLVVIRLGSQLPVPGVDRDYFSAWHSTSSMHLLAVLLKICPCLL